MDTAATLDAVAEELAEARRVLFITGAGISADSGLPTYRGVGGLYEEDLTVGRLLHRRGAVRPPCCASIPRSPGNTWPRSSAPAATPAPNRAHQVIADLERRGTAVTVFTQNIDGLHRQAGSSDVIEIHGRLHHLHCTRCSYETEVDSFSNLELPPACPRCKRPGTAPGGTFRRIPAADGNGTAAPHPGCRAPTWSFPSALPASFPMWPNRCCGPGEQGITTVEINPGTTPRQPLRRPPHHPWGCRHPGGPVATPPVNTVRHPNGLDFLPLAADIPFFS